MNDRYQGLRDAIASIVPETWHSPGAGDVHDEDHNLIAACVGLEWDEDRQSHYPDLHQGQVVAAYVAAADPDTIAALLKERDAGIDIARAIIAICESGQNADLACTEHSPLVDAARLLIERAALADGEASNGLRVRAES